MFRKFFAAVVAMMLVVGGLFAEDIKGMFKKYEDGKLTFVNEDGKEKTYKVSPDAKVGKEGKEKLLTDVIAKWKDGDKIVVTVDKDTVTKAKKAK